MVQRVQQQLPFDGKADNTIVVQPKKLNVLIDL